MSHQATSWAIFAANGLGLSPAAKLVLWHLADRHNPDFGCFPSQERVADDCEVSRSQLNVHLGALERAGLIRRTRQVDRKTRQRKQTRYLFAFEAGFEALPSPPVEVAEQAELPLPQAEPCPEIGHGTMSGNEPKPCPESNQSHVRPTGHKPVIEPVREPVVCPASESAVDKAFADFWKAHPRPRDLEATRDRFREAVIAGEDASSLVAAAASYAREQEKNSVMYICRSDNWLAGKRWKDHAAAAELAGPIPDNVVAFWASRIVAGKPVPAESMPAGLARQMLDRGLVSPADLVSLGLEA